MIHSLKIIVLSTRPSKIGSPERVKIHSSLMQNLSKIQRRQKIIGRFLTFWGVNTPRRSQKNWGVKLTSKLNSQHHRNTQCENFWQNQTTFKKSLSQGVS